MPPLITINLENVSDEEVLNYKTREASRAVVFDNDGKVALLHATKFNYFKLPGGGIENDESPEIALKRECLEEIGCNVEIIKDLGIIIELRKKYNLKNKSYCYTAKLINEKGNPQLMPDEIEEGFQTVWLPIEEALKKVKSGKKEVYEAQYMIARDTMIIEKSLK